MARFGTSVVAFLVNVALVAISSHLVQPANSSNILGVFLSPSPSHLVIHMSVAKALAERGHNVTVVTLYKPKVQHENITSILIPPVEELQAKFDAAMARMSGVKLGFIEHLVKVSIINRIGIEMQYEAFVNRQFVALYENKDNQFDVAIVGYVFNDFQVSVGTKFKCPVIVTWVQQPISFVDHFVGNPAEISYVPSMMNPLRPGEVWNFRKRLNNYYFEIVERILLFSLDYAMQGYYKKLAEADSSLPSYKEIKRNVSLLFCNSHYSEGPIRPLAPATVLIGGIQIKDKPDPLPKNIAEFLDDSQQNGAILFSLGTNVKESHIKAGAFQIIFNVLSTLKQNVIWKWEDLANTPGNASNIIYQKWLPQDDILAHPNLKLFITHAGKGGMIEAIYHGVPMVSIPVFGDQPMNSMKIVSQGYGVEVDKFNITESIFRSAVDEVLNNPSYTDKVKTFSRLYRDRPLTAKESVIYWTEYVIRHRGAVHLQSPVVHMNYIESENLDIHLLILGTLFAIFKLLQLVARFFKKILFGARKSKSKKE